MECCVEISDSFMCRVLYSFIFLLSLGKLYAQSQQSEVNYGLAFASHEVSKDRRTGLNLNPDGPFRINQDFAIDFDLSLQRLTNAYGYILRVIANDSINIDLMSTPEHNEFDDLVLVINNKPTTIQFGFTEISLKEFQWTKIKVSFSFSKNEISVQWNNKIKTQAFSLKNLKNFRFYLGANDFGKYNTTDVPPIIVRNITLTKDNKLLLKWLLKNHDNTDVYDSIQYALATVKNPHWLIDQHTKWVHRKSITVGRYPSVAFNKDSSTLYITDQKSLTVYNLIKEKVEKKIVKGNSISTDANQMLFTEDGQQLLNYDLHTNKVLSYNFENNSWPNTDTTYQEPIYWHNNKFYNSTDSSLYTFGGYGFFAYKNTFSKFDKTTKRWISIKPKGFIPPRYLAAAGLRKDSNQLYIFGGYGSISGKQELSPQSFYDLYSFDLKSYEIKKIREYAPSGVEDMVFSNSLILNEPEHCFYVLSYPKNKFQSQIRLRQYSLDNTDSKELADFIPFQFHDEDSFCDLFFSKASKELVAITVHKEKETYQVEVYSIKYPPLHTEDVLQTPKPARAITLIVIISAILIIGIGVTVFVVYRRKTKKSSLLSVPKNHETESIHSTHQINQYIEESKPVSSILLFGGFQVFNKNGDDISSKFTMTLKELLSLILLHSVKFEIGVSATMIQEYLWPDKDEVSARNNRNVNIKKLRSLLEEVSNISIENNNAYLRIIMDDQVFCDYQTIYRLLNPDKHSTLSEFEKINFIIRSVKRGSLLPNLQTSWIDSFKSDISNQVIDTLLEFSHKLDSSKDDKLLLEIADAIFTYDIINQEALVIKCSVLNKKGKYSLAKTWYDHFVKEYKTLYAENYPKTFEEVIS